jgi:hypothetical protein
MEKTVSRKQLSDLSPDLQECYGRWIKIPVNDGKSIEEFLLARQNVLAKSKQKEKPSIRINPSGQLICIEDLDDIRTITEQFGPHDNAQC